MSTKYAYLGHVNLDRTEGRGPMVPQLLALDVDALVPTLERLAGYTGQYADLIEIDPPTPRLHADAVVSSRGIPVLGSWIDELGTLRSGLLPTEQPQRWSTQRIARYRELADRFPDVPAYDADRALAYQTLPSPALPSADSATFFLLFADDTCSIGTSSDKQYLGRLLAVYSTLEAAQAGALQHIETQGEFRLHVMSVTVPLGEGDPARAVATFDLTDHALGHTPSVPPWFFNDRRPSHLNVTSKATVVWSNDTAAAQEEDPARKELDRILQEARLDVTRLATVGTSCQTQDQTAKYALPHGARWERSSDAWVVVRDADD